MVQTVLTKTAQNAIFEILERGIPDSLVMVVTSLSYANMLVGRLMDRSVLEILKTQQVGEILPGIDLYLFGVESLTADSIIKIDCLPSTESVSGDSLLQMPFRVSVTTRQSSLITLKVG
jgi:hypothetical protein